MKYNQGFFTPKNPKKLIGNQSPKYRSSWELAYMSFLDQHPNVINWASESIRIPYINPLTGKGSVYVPDFLVYYIDKNGRKHAELIEIKPEKERLVEKAKSRKDKLFLILNTAKWVAAQSFCAKNNLHFRVISETELFVNVRTKKR